jgi:hypothetical protein
MNEVLRSRLHTAKPGLFPHSDTPLHPPAADGISVLPAGATEAMVTEAALSTRYGAPVRVAQVGQGDGGGGAGSVLRTCANKPRRVRWPFAFELNLDRRLAILPCGRDGILATEGQMANEKVAFQILHLTPGPNAGFVAMFQQELWAALNNYVLLKKSGRQKAQQTLMTQQREAETSIKSELKVLSKQIETEAKGKVSGTKQKLFNERAPVVRHRIADPVVQGFEVSYAATRTNKQDVLDRVEQVAKFHGYPDAVRCSQRGTPDNYYVQVFNGASWSNVIEMWFGAARFVPKSGVDGVYQHRTQPTHEYVQDRHGFFISRYLIRNLSEFDRGKITTSPTPDPVLTAKSNRVPTEETLIEDITTHVRAKEASGGATCFISFSHTKHMIVGSTAALFYRQEKGDVVIDASKVSKDARVDLHSLDAVKKLFGVTEVKPTMAFKEGDEAYEQNAAARDTVRTREILIAGAVPKDAVVAVRLSTSAGKVPWTTLAGAPATLPDGVPQAWKT